MKTILIILSLCCALVLQGQVSKTVNLKAAGSLRTNLSITEVNTITNITIKGVIDAQDINTLYYMPLLEVIDMSEAHMMAYIDEYGTSVYLEQYRQNQFPANAFCRFRNRPDGPEYSAKTTLRSVALPNSLTSIGAYAFYECCNLNSISIPASVTSLDYYTFYNCTGLTSIYAQSKTPISLFDGTHVFYGINKETCILYVPFGSKELYANANQWKDFKNIVEEGHLLNVNTNSLSFEATGDTVIVDAMADVTWTAISDKQWLKDTPAKGKRNESVKFTALPNLNSVIGKEKVTVSAPGSNSQVMTIIQQGLPKAIEVTAGGLLSALTGEEMNSITHLILTGTIDASDFKTMREGMPMLELLDMSGARIVASDWYQANEIPEAAFFDVGNEIGKESLKTVLLPTTLKSIGGVSFLKCTGLTCLTIPASVTSIGWCSFSNCSALASIYSYSKIPVDLKSSELVFYEVNKETFILYVPFGSKELYAAANQWKDFQNIVEMPGFTLSAVGVSLTAEQGSTDSLMVASNLQWTASSDQPWLKVDPATGQGNQPITFTADANPSGTERTAMVTVSATGADSQIITITQEALITGVADRTPNKPIINCYPNPFSRQVSVEIQNPAQEKITADIYNLAGQKVKNLADGNTSPQLRLVWDGSNEKGQPVVSGVYLLRINGQIVKLVKW